MDFYVESLMDQQQEAYGLQPRHLKQKESFERDMLVFDWLAKNSWASFKPKQDWAAPKKERIKSQSKLEFKIAKSGV